MISLTAFCWFTQAAMFESKTKYNLNYLASDVIRERNFSELKSLQK